MKKILFTFIVTLVLTACGGDDASPTDQFITNLTAHAWGHPEVTNDPDGNLSDQYEDLVIAFSPNNAGGFQGDAVIAHGGIAFSESTDRWRFSDDHTQLIFESGRVADVTLSSSLLTLEFSVAPEGGRLKGLSGHFIFELHPL